eukprot:scaffold1554_cov332-Pavlova_lutheri.AAC.9
MMRMAAGSLERRSCLCNRAGGGRHDIFPTRTHVQQKLDGHLPMLQRGAGFYSVPTFEQHVEFSQRGAHFLPVFPPFRAVHLHSRAHVPEVQARTAPQHELHEVGVVYSQPPVPFPVFSMFFHPVFNDLWTAVESLQPLVFLGCFAWVGQDVGDAESVGILHQLGTRQHERHVSHRRMSVRSQSIPRRRHGAVPHAASVGRLDGEQP